MLPYQWVSGRVVKTWWPTPLGGKKKKKQLTVEEMIVYDYVVILQYFKIEYMLYIENYTSFSILFLYI